MAADYWVDYEDAAFPTIRHKSHPSYDPQFVELISLTKARQEIKKTCRQERQHWLAVMNYQLSRTSDSIQLEARER